MFNLKFKNFFAVILLIYKGSGLGEGFAVIIFDKICKFCNSQFRANFPMKLKLLNLQLFKTRF